MLLNRPPLIHHQTLTVRHSQPQQRRLRLDGWLLPLLLVLLRHLLVVWLLNILQKGGTQRHSPAHAKLLLLGKLLSLPLHCERLLLLLQLLLLQRKLSLLLLEHGLLRQQARSTSDDDLLAGDHLHVMLQRIRVKS